MQQFVVDASNAILDRSKESLKTDSKPISRPIGSSPAKHTGKGVIAVESRASRGILTFLEFIRDRGKV
jgi:hypothetical protein